MKKISTKETLILKVNRLFHKGAHQLRIFIVLVTILLFCPVFQTYGQTFTTGNANYTIPGGVTSVKIKVWGAGGGGGGLNAIGRGSGGGGGAYSEITLSVTPGQIFRYNVGAGASSGANGGDSWVGTINSVSTALVLAKGGSGGISNGAGGSGGQASEGIGTNKYSGGSGGTTLVNSARSGQGGSSASPNGHGLSGGIANGTVTAPVGGGNGANGVNSNNNGVAGGVPGGGGSGAYGTNATARTGGGGGAGRIEFENVTASASFTGWGSGSRDLFPPGHPGVRAALISAAPGFYSAAYGFVNLGVQKVYAEAGETLYLGSSAQNIGAGRIRVYKPSNSLRTAAASNATSGADNTGLISNRTQELAGPNRTGVTTGYTPFVVPVDETGVWEIHFIAPNGDAFNSNSTPTTGNYDQPLGSANAWTQNNTVSNIVAWDVTVAQGSTIKPGRVYQNVFNTWSSYGNVNTGFYGKFYVLTKDGYPYLVDNNGMQGIAFAFFVNNRGFTTGANGTGTKTYKSLNSSTNPNVKNPNQPDDPAGANQNITHKIFYGKPGADLPDYTRYMGDATGAWLKINPPEPPKADNITFIGAEGNDGYASSKGGVIKFNSNVAGTYRLVIPGGTFGGVTFYERVLAGASVEGLNEVIWDGKSGTQADPLVAAAPLPPGTTLTSLDVQVFGAEVHFPFLDVEQNPNGILIQQLNKDNYELLRDENTNEIIDVVYWNDSDITSSQAGPTVSNVGVGTNGIRSSINGHKWLQAGSDQGYGNEKSLDTYTFLAGALTSKGISVTILEADLEVSSFTSNIAAPSAVNIGDTWEYYATVKNNGPIDIITNTDPGAGRIVGPAKFRLYLPAGITIDPTQLIFNSTNGVSIIGTPTFTPSVDATTGGIFEISMDMLNGSEGTISIPVTAIAAISQTGNGDINAYATILRPADFNDPDATNTTVATIVVPPTDPFYEADGIRTYFSTAIYTNPAGVSLASTNNIKRHSLPTMKADLRIIKTGKQSAGGNGVGSFTLEVTNLGTSKASGVTVTDVFSTRYLISNYNATTGTVVHGSGSAPTLTWTIGDLDVNETQTIIINTQNTGTTNRANTASVIGEQYDPVTSNNNSSVDFGSTISPVTDLAITKTVNGDPTASVMVGSTVVFEIIVRKISGDDVTGVEVRDLLPSGFTITGTPLASNGTYVANTGLWTIGSVSGATEYKLTINAIVNTPTGDPLEYTNTATITKQSNLDNTPSNDSATATVTVGSMFITNPMIYQRLLNN